MAIALANIVVGQGPATLSSRFLHGTQVTSIVLRQHGMVVVLSDRLCGSFFWSGGLVDWHRLQPNLPNLRQLTVPPFGGFHQLRFPFIAFSGWNQLIMR
jgi:hypothetical protein